MFNFLCVCTEGSRANQLTVMVLLFRLASHMFLDQRFLTILEGILITTELIFKFSHYRKASIRSCGSFRLFHCWIKVFLQLQAIFSNRPYPFDFLYLSIYLQMNMKIDFVYFMITQNQYQIFSLQFVPIKKGLQIFEILYK